MDNVFMPEDLALLQQVVDDACVTIVCDEAQKEIIASRVLSCATSGPRDYQTLLAAAKVRFPTEP